MLRDSTAGMYLDEDEWVETFPENYYSTDFFTDRLLGYLKSQKQNRQQPFFAYLPFQAPHFPLQVSKDYIQRYHGHYAAGPENIRAARVERLKELGFIPKDTKPADFQTYPKRKSNRSWEQRDHVARERSARKIDLAENVDLRYDEPERFEEMLVHWGEYAKKHGIIDIKTVETAYALHEQEWTDDELEDIV